ncbi:MAG: EamA family transporter [Bacteroidales bacterium]|nr:EamA family transporter [Bacteroidales bacterium]MBN2758040.1 EamA family transporter [Bacteroidales bacterium]
MLEKNKIKLFPIIVLNYITASVFGLLFSKANLSFNYLIQSNWLPVSSFLGFLFVIVFFTIGYSSQKVGLTITSISTKMSVVIPILFSILFYNEEIYILKFIGIIIALLALFLASYKGKKKENLNRTYIFLPFLLFFGAGSIDSIVKYSQEEYLKNVDIIEFSAISFIFSVITSLVVFIFLKNKFKQLILIKNLFWGISLGLANFASLYFTILALNTNIFASSIVFSIISTGIILISVIAGFKFFNEKIEPINWLGVALSVLAILILSV